MARRRRNTVEVLPSASRLVGSLRDLGYQPSEAVADLVDNSIAANAREIDITIGFEGSDSWIRIADDGVGMNGATINEAMRYGTERDYEDEDLGKFGLGLKTASMSCCRCVSVASRTSESIARIEARELDLDYIEEHNTWSVIVLGADERGGALVEPLRARPGTVVLWEDLDRILPYKDPGGGWARRRLLRLAEELERHLGMVFHRFLAGEVPRRRKLTIRINGTAIEPWDPYAREEKETRVVKAEEFELHTAHGSGIVRLEPFILPPQKSFSTDTAWQRASGPASWNRQQGFYVYRAQRLIQSGGWSHMRTQDEHTKLARVGMFFSPELDAAFGINVAKMRVTLPGELTDQIRPTVDKVVRRAREIYSKKETKGHRSTAGSTTTGGSEGAGGRGSGETGLAESGSGRRGGEAPGPSAGGSGALGAAGDRREALERAARDAKEHEALSRIVEQLSRTAPEVARDLGY